MVTCAQCGRESPDEFGFCPGCGAPLAATAPREVRKVVTVLFCDLTGSTAIGERTDPEALRALMNRYYDTAREVLERHGGTVEKFVGDAVMAVFGIPVAREDDALRAVRSAVELREVVHELGLEARIGVNTGAVVAGEGETLVTGDAVNVAARLEQSAAPGEILLGETTVHLVRDAVETEPLELTVKGKAAPLAVRRLRALDARSAGVARRLERPMVGRSRERERLRGDFADVVEGGACRLVTLIGPAGVGKSRLVADFLDDVGAAAEVARGRALSYGEGITYWPLVEMLVQLGIEPSDAIRSSHADTQLSTRALLERRASERPVVLVIDDLHWAEPPMLDLVEHIADWSRGAPIMLLCLARPELLDVRPSWAGGKLNATSVLLEPLDACAADELAEELLAGVELEADTRARILQAAEGNPLFLEEMALLAREADGAVDVPPTIRALLQARLDTLNDGERTVIERGAVEGQVFHRGAVTALAPTAPPVDVAGQLVSLMRKELVRPDRALIAGDDAFRFRHLLIRDTAYESLPKGVRAELHERFADWLEANGQLVEQEEIVGYHLEQAAAYRVELDPVDVKARALGERAAAHLSRAGLRAFDRDDLDAARNLLERAVALMPPGRERRLLYPCLLHALLEAGDPSLVSTLAELELGDELEQAIAVVFRIASDPVLSADEAEHRRLDEAQALLEADDDLMGIVFAETARAFLHWGAARTLEAHRAYRRAYDVARTLGSPALVRWLAGNLVFSAIFGGVHLDEIRRLLDDIERDVQDPGPLFAAVLRSWRTRVDYQAGRVDLATAQPIVEEEIGLLVQTGSLLQAETAKNFLRKAAPFMEGDQAALDRGRWDAVVETKAHWRELYLANELGNWALSLCARGDAEEALRVVDEARPHTRQDDVADQLVLDAAEAWARALLGEVDGARAALARAHAWETDMVVAVDQLEHVEATVEALLGNPDRARVLLVAIVERNEALGRQRYADRFRRDLAALDSPARD